jgi:hypothetical protein
MPPLLVRVHGIRDAEWNEFARTHYSFLRDLIERHDAQLEMRLKANPDPDGQFWPTRMREGDIDGWFELQPRDPERADRLARELATRFRMIGGVYAHAVVSVCVVRFRVHHSYGG